MNTLSKQNKQNKNIQFIYLSFNFWLGLSKFINSWYNKKKLHIRL